MVSYLQGLDNSGNCCEDCECAEICEGLPNIWVRLEWDSPCKDLDSSILWNSTRVGWNCNDNFEQSYKCNQNSSEPKICWFGDNVQTGGYEEFGIYFNFADLLTIGENKDGVKMFRANIYASWYQPNWEESCGGTFHFSVNPKRGQPGVDNEPFFEKTFTNFFNSYDGCSENIIAFLFWNETEVKLDYAS